MDVYALLQQQLLRSFLKSSKCVCTHRSPLLLVQMWPQTSENLRRMQREWATVPVLVRKHPVAFCGHMVT